MDKRLNFLESFPARGTDGQIYKVCGYEQLARDESFALDTERWAPTGLAEYRLADGAAVDARTDGSLSIRRTGVGLERIKSMQ